MTRDPGWTRFKQALIHSKPADLSWQDLAEQLNALSRDGSELVDGPKLRAWASKDGGNPRFSQLPLLSIVLGHDAAYLAQVMGMVPNEDDEIARLVQLRTQVDDLESRLRRLDVAVSERRNSRVGSIVAEATKTAELAVAVWPAVEGPEGYPMHISDRLDFTRTDGRELSVEHLRSFPSVTAALDSAHAVFATTGPRWLDKIAAKESVLSYSVPRLTAVFPPGVNTPYVNQGSVAVVALSQATWVMDVAGFIARILNYGLQTTRALATETYGYAIKNPESIEHHRVARRKIHNELLHNPQIRHVWGHFGLPTKPADLFPASDDRWPKSLTCVWLCESDALIDSTIKTTLGEDVGLQLRQARDDVARYVERERKERIIRIDVDSPPMDASTGLDHQQTRNLRLLGALEAAVEAIVQMHARKFVTTQDLRVSVSALNSDDRSGIARTLHRWIVDEARLRTILGERS